jgi:hypothetical protein
MFEQELAILLNHPLGSLCVAVFVFAVSFYIFCRGAASFIIAVEGKPLLEIYHNDPDRKDEGKESEEKGEEENG